MYVIAALIDRDKESLEPLLSEFSYKVYLNMWICCWILASYRGPLPGFFWVFYQVASNFIVFLLRFCLHWWSKFRAKKPQKSSTKNLEKIITDNNLKCNMFKYYGDHLIHLILHRRLQLSPIPLFLRLLCGCVDAADWHATWFCPVVHNSG